MSNQPKVVVKQSRTLRNSFAKSALQKKTAFILQDEIELLQYLSHDNIVEYRGYVADSEHVYIVLEYVIGSRSSGALPSTPWDANHVR